MNEFNVQLGELGYPFPSKILEKRLTEAGIEFKQFQKSSAEGGLGSSIFYIRDSDLEKAILLKTKIESEDAESSLKHRHPIVKIIGYVGCILIFLWLIWKLYNILL